MFGCPTPAFLGFYRLRFDYDYKPSNERFRQSCWPDVRVSIHFCYSCPVVRDIISVHLFVVRAYVSCLSSLFPCQSLIKLNCTAPYSGFQRSFRLDFVLIFVYVLLSGISNDARIRVNSFLPEALSWSGVLGGRSFINPASKYPEARYERAQYSLILPPAKPLSNSSWLLRC